MMIMSHCGISVIMSDCTTDKEELKTGARKETCPEFYMINPYTFSDCELRCTRYRDVGHHEKYMNGGNTGVFKKNSVCKLYTSTRKQRRNQCLDRKGNISDEFPWGGDLRAGVYGWNNNYLALILLIACLENGDSFDIYRRGSHTQDCDTPNLLTLPEFYRRLNLIATAINRLRWTNNNKSHSVSRA